MTPDERLRRYHRLLSAEIWPTEVDRRDKLFRSNHRIGADHEIAPALDAILVAHRQRVTGTGCPADCDAVLREALS